MNSRNLIIVAIFIVIVILLGIFTFAMPHDKSDGKLNTEIKFLSKDTLKSGEAIQFQLKDAKGNVLPGQNMTIEFIEDGQTQTYSIITDYDGKGSLVLNNEQPGSYDVNVKYNGTLTYNGCSAKQTIKIEEGIAEPEPATDSNSNGTSSEPVQSNSSAGTSLYNGGNSSSPGELYYDSQYNFYYDQNGVIRGGQNDGYSAQYIRDIYESGDMIDEDGNLQ